MELVLRFFTLAKRGFEIIGSDLSFKLLEIARKKAEEEKLNLKFIDGDIINLQAGKFDAVITMFNAIRHLKKSDFEKAIKNVNGNLKNDGIYIFDIFNFDAMNDENIAKLACFSHKKIDETQIITAQFSTLDKKSKILTSYNNYSSQKNIEKPKFFKHKFSLQIYNINEIEKMLAKNGFEIAEKLAIDGSKFIKEESLQMLIVARKLSF